MKNKRFEELLFKFIDEEIDEIELLELENIIGEMSGTANRYRVYINTVYKRSIEVPY